MKKPYDCHEAEPDKLLTVREVMPHLCEDACWRGALNETACMVCSTGCAYGKRLLDLIGLRYADAGKDSVLKQMLSPSVARPTLRHRTGERGSRRCSE